MTNKRDQYRQVLIYENDVKGVEGIRHVNHFFLQRRAKETVFFSYREFLSIQ